MMCPTEPKQDLSVVWIAVHRERKKKKTKKKNEYLERLTRTGPKRLHILYKYILSKFNAYNMNAHTKRDK